MSSDKKIEKITKINNLFSAFITRVTEDSVEINKKSEFLKGYEQCIKDLLSDIGSENESDFAMIIRAKIEASIKEEIYKEILDGAITIHNGIKKALEE